MSDTFHLSGLAGSFEGRNALRNIEQLNAALGTNLPKEFTESLTRLDDNRKKILDELESQPELSEILAEALKTGESILEGSHLTKVLAATAYRDLRPSQILEQAYEKEARAEISRNLPALFKAWAKPVAQAARAITAANKELPGVSLREQQSAANLTPSQFKLWAPGHAAIKTLDTVIAHASPLYGLTSVGVPSQHRRILAIAPLTLQQLETLRDDRPSGAPAGYGLETLEGIQISLADPDELAHRITTVQKQIERQAQAARDRQARQYRREFATPFNASTRQAVDNLNG